RGSKPSSSDCSAAAAAATGRWAAPSPCSAISFSRQPPERLAARPDGELVERDPRPALGHLVRGDARAQEGGELVGGDVAGDQRRALLAPVGVRPAVDDRSLYGWVLGEGTLDLGGIDVGAAGDDEVVLAVDEDQAAVAGAARDVAGGDEGVGRAR